MPYWFQAKTLTHTHTHVYVSIKKAYEENMSHILFSLGIYLKLETLIPQVYINIMHLINNFRPLVFILSSISVCYTYQLTLPSTTPFKHRQRVSLVLLRKRQNEKRFSISCHFPVELPTPFVYLNHEKLKINTLVDLASKTSYGFTLQEVVLT